MKNHYYTIACTEDFKIYFHFYVYTYKEDWAYALFTSDTHRDADHFHYTIV
jgi:hypothetical protein